MFKRTVGDACPYNLIYIYTFKSQFIFLARLKIFKQEENYDESICDYLDSLQYEAEHFRFHCFTTVADSGSSIIGSQMFTDVSRYAHFADLLFI